MVRLGVLSSGNGTNAVNIVQFAKSHPEELQVAAVVTDNPEAGVIQKMRSWDIPVKVIPFSREVHGKGLDGKRAHEQEILHYLQKQRVGWVCLAGYMRILSGFFLHSFYDEHQKNSRVVNIHPSLLPRFPGKDAYRESFLSGEKSSGVTLHFVDTGVDTGPIIFQEPFERREEDSLEDFRGRGLEVEYKVYRRFLSHLMKGEVASLSTR